MKNQSSLVLTLLRKDLRLFWPFAALIAALLMLREFPGIIALLGQLGGLLQLGLNLGMVLLILVVCQEDAVVSLKHDWLTRPVPGATLLLAKVLFVILATVLPVILAAFVYNLTQGASIAEAGLAGFSAGAAGDQLMVYATVMAFAAITANARQAVIVFLACLAVMAIVTVSWAAMRQVPESPMATGSGWVQRRSIEMLQLLTAASILWIQYRHRLTKVARTIAAVAAIAGTGMVTLLTWPAVFDVQKALSSDSAGAAPVQLEMAEGCFSAGVLDADQAAAGEMSARPTARRYSEEHRKAAGPGAIAFFTRVLAPPLSAGEMLVVDHARVGYYSGGQELQHLRAGMTSIVRMSPVDGRPAADHYWLLSDADAKRLASTVGVETRLDYSLSLLVPKHSAQFLADGVRSYYPGIGFCGASFDRAAGTVAVRCFKPGAQPARLTANLDGVADSTAVSSYRMYFMPAALDFWGGAQHKMQLVARGTQAPRVNVTAYQASAHFDQRLVRPGVLGGTTNACPVRAAP